MLGRDQAPLRQFKVDGRGAEPGRKRQRIYGALDEQDLFEVAKDGGTVIEAYVETDPQSPSERQLEYADKLGIKGVLPNASFYEVSNLINQTIKRGLVHGGRVAGLTVPDEISYEQGRDLEGLLGCADEDGKEIWRHSSFPADLETRSARVIGVTGIAEYTGAAMLFARAWKHLDADPDKAKLAAWYIYNAYIDLPSSRVSESLVPDDPRLLVLAEEFLQDEKAAKSLFRPPAYLRFRAQQGGWSEYVLMDLARPWPTTRLRC